MKKSKIICWWSGGVTSAVACKIASELYGLENCEFIMIDTGNEDEDTYRFKKECEEWYGANIISITGVGHGSKYGKIQDVWYKHKSLNVATGAICSSELKRKVREDWEKTNDFTHQVFGFDWSEYKRAKSMKLNHSHTEPLFPLLMYGYSKKDCIDVIQKAGIEIPMMYQLGFHNNNCFKTGCVQGGIGYWQKMKRDFPEKFEAMAKVEHDLTDVKGKAVTMCKDQSNEAKEKPYEERLVFLKPHPDYPYLKSIDDMEGREPEPLTECNGFCGTNDLSKRKKVEQEINMQPSLF